MTSHRLRRATSLGLASLLALQPLLAVPASARPEGAKVVRGDVSVGQAGDTTVIHASDRSIIEYRSFDVGAREKVQFIQPSELARVLNRIEATKPSRIDGSILANGQVYIVNPAGVIFGQDAVIDVARLVASAGSISNEDFVSGVDHFTEVMGPVQNQGQIDARIVELIGRQVANQGTIDAEGGWITMVAGDDVILGSPGGNMFVRIEGGSLAAPDPPGVVNEGSLSAEGGRVVLAAGDVYSLALRHSGTTVADEIQLDGGANGRVEVSGSLDASNDAGTGGRIDVLGDKVALLDAELDASGRDGGGSVHVGGDFQGKGELRTASRTYVSSEATIRADATAQGDGGTVIVWGDEVTGFYGDIQARGGAAGGDGGFAEVSGKEALLYRGSTDLRAPQGEVGTLLLDPTDVQIGGGTGDNTADADVLSSRLGDISGALAGVTIFESEVEGQSSLADVLIQAGNTVSIDLTPSTPPAAGLINVLELQNDFSVSAVGAFSMLDGSIAAGANDVAISGSSVQVGAITANNVQLRATTGNVTQAGAIVANGLGAEATLGDVVLPDTGNDVNVFAAKAGDEVAFRDADGFDVGTVPSVTVSGLTVGSLSGITATNVQLEAGVGTPPTPLDGADSLTQSQKIVATRLGARVLDGNVELTNTANDVGTFAASAVGNATTGNVAFRDADGFEVGQASAVSTLAVLNGITATNVQLEAGVGTPPTPLDGADSITQSQKIVATRLGARALDGNVELTNTANDVGTFAASAVGNAATGNVAFRDADGFDVGQATAVSTLAVLDGITATNVQLEAGVGTPPTPLDGADSLTQSQKIVAARLGARALDGNVELTNGANDVGTFAASATGGVLFRDLDEFSLGNAVAVGGLGAFSGVTSTGTGAVDLRAGGAITADVGADMRLGDNAVTLIGTAVGTAANPIKVTGDDDGDSSLVVTSSGGVDVDVATDEFDSIALTLSSASSNANIDLEGTDGIDVVGEVSGTPGASTITADTTKHGADLAFKLTQTSRNVRVGALGIKVASDVQLESAGDVTQAAPIVANGLGAKAGGAVLLDDPLNQVDTFAAEAGTHVAFRDSNGGFEVGMVPAVGGISPRMGINAPGNVQLQADSGDLTQNQVIDATALGARASAGNVHLASAANKVGTFAASTASTGNVEFLNQNGFTVGSAPGVSTLTALNGIATPAPGLARVNNVQLQANSGNLAQSQAIRAKALGVRASAGNVNLASAANDVGTFAASTSATGNVEFLNQNGFTVGSAPGVSTLTTLNGIATPAPGLARVNNVQLQASSGNLTQDQAIKAATLGARATTGNVHLASAANDVGTFAVSTASTGNVEFSNQNAFTVGTAPGVSTLTTLDGIATPAPGLARVNNVQLQASSGNLMQDQAIKAATLGARATTGNVHLASVANDVGTFAASTASTGNVEFSNQNGFTVGTAPGVSTLTTLDGIATPAPGLARVNNVQLQASGGNLTQDQAIKAATLGARATTGNVHLASVANDVGTFAASTAATGNVAFLNQNGFTVGTAPGVSTLTTLNGIATPAIGRVNNVQLQANSGNLAQSQAIEAATLGARATGGNVHLASAVNDVGTFAASTTATGDVAFLNQNGFTVGTAPGVSTLTTLNGIATPGLASVNNVQLQADSGDITQTATITAAGLGAKATNGNVVLGSAALANDVGTFEAQASGNLAFRDPDEFAVADVAAVNGLGTYGGIAATTAQLQADSGDITQSAAIGATNLGARAATGSVLLGSVANDAGTFEASAAGSVAFRDGNSFVVGDVAPVNGIPTAAQSGISAPTGNVQLQADSGDITQTHAILASGLGAQASNGNVLLTNAANAVARFAAEAGGASHDVAFREANGFQVGTVAPVSGLGPVDGITATRNVQLQAITGDITQSTAALDEIEAAGLAARADTGSVLLDHPANDVETFAASANGSVDFRDTDDLVVGSVAAVGAIPALTGVAATTGSIELDAPLLLVFDTGVANVSAGGDIRLNTDLGDPTAIPPAATIVGRATSLTLTAGGDIEIGVEDARFGSGQKFSALGDLMLSAGGTVQTGDLSALTLEVDANTIRIVRRESGPVLLADGTLVGDGGVDFVANTIDLTATTIEDVGSEGKMFFSTQNGAVIPGVPRPNVDSFFNTVFEPPRTLTTADLLLGTQVLDLVGAGSIQTALSTQPILIEEITLGPEFFAKLIDQAKGGKPPWASEIVEYLECSLFEGEDEADVPPECREYLAQAPDQRFDTQEAQTAKERYQAIYGQADAIYASFQKAASDYLARTPSGAATGRGFRSFVERSPAHAEARAHLEDIAALFRAVSGINPEQAEAADLEQWRILLLQDVTPSGLSAEELEDAIGAGRGPTAPTALRLILRAGDGIPMSMR